VNPWSRQESAQQVHSASLFGCLLDDPKKEFQRLGNKIAQRCLLLSVLRKRVALASSKHRDHLSIKNYHRYLAWNQGWIDGGCDTVFG
jgi:hypothetical protein